MVLNAFAVVESWTRYLLASCHIRQQNSAAANHLSAPKHYCFFIKRKCWHQPANQSLRVYYLMIYVVRPLFGWRKILRQPTAPSQHHQSDLAPGSSRCSTSVFSLSTMSFAGTAQQVLLCSASRNHQARRSSIEKFAEARRRQSYAIAHRARLFVST
jgi:hypothetical protein